MKKEFTIKQRMKHLLRHIKEDVAGWLILPVLAILTLMVKR